MKILITGGAGYIGSHITKQLLEQTQHNIYVLDNLTTGFNSTINTLQNIRSFSFLQIDLANFEQVADVFKTTKIEAIFHFAAYSQVAESMREPLQYYKNNSANTINLIECAEKFQVQKFIFSSTAAVYGIPPLAHSAATITEDSATNPINPYGYSKLISETVLIDTANNSKHLQYCILRYFNVAGADMFYQNNKLLPRIGECHQPETHLIPLVIKTALNKRDFITVYGSDYATADGTCVRDYIHIEDLADAHIKALTYLENNQSDIFNCGYGIGYSVAQIIDSVKSITKQTFTVKQGDRRPGDPPTLIADNKKILAKMNWQPKYNALSDIINSAYNWEQSLKN